jgi:predicted ATPase
MTLWVPIDEQNEYGTSYLSSVGATNFYVITGCSGGGKSTLLSELEKRGYQVFPEPGRQIVKEQQSVDGDGLPWKNATKFAELCVSRAIYFYNSALLLDPPVFFDRSVIDNISGIERLGLPMPVYFPQTLVQYRYAQRVFMVPPWPEIFAQDAERQHSYAEAEQEYYGLQRAYKANNYEVILIPKLPVDERADFIERELFHSS